MAKRDQENYRKLFEKSYDAKILEGISNILGWDQETMMPEGASTIRGEQLKTMAGLIHKSKTSPDFKEALGNLIDIKNGKIIAKGLSKEQESALKCWRKDYLRDVALPEEFVKNFAKITSEAQVVWRNAKKENNFKLFAPYLEKIIELVKQKSRHLSKKGSHLYDALLDEYEPGMTTEDVDALFKKIKDPIIALLKKIKSKKQVKDDFLHGKFPDSKQVSFSQILLDDMGYDKAYGRLDFSTHPFSSSSHPTDSRITTRIHPTSLMSNISVILHEGGHALYEMGLDPKEYGSPLGQAVSLGIHESQSRFWETRIGKNKAFWKHYFPLLKKAFPKGLEKIDLDLFYKAINKVEPSFIRVEADEVTYPLHVILRFELEKDLIEGKLKVKDLPKAWNKKMKEYFGITPKNDQEGCLQDVHWSMGAFGYFPTYALGNMYAAHLFETLEKEQPDLEKKLEKGQLAFLKEWLKDKVYRYGRQFESLELLKVSTGKPFTEKAYVDYLQKKYKEIYGL